MKKTFNLTAPNKEPERQVESIIHEIRKYVKRERKKSRPEDVDYWDFDCRIGTGVTNATVFKLDALHASITKFAKEENETIYIEILSKPGRAENRKMGKLEKLTSTKES